jgi:lambda family phage tail tape measure protein
MSDFNLDLEFSANGADAVVGLLEQVYKGSAKVVDGNDNLVESSAKVAKASQNLSTQIERAILSYADSRSQVLAYTAAQLGQTAAMEGQLAMLREMETHEREATAAFSLQKQQKRELAGLEQDLARDIQRRMAEEAKAIEEASRLQAKQLAERKAAAAEELKAREAYYAGIVSAANKAAQGETDARHRAILATQDATREFTELHNKQQKDASVAAEKQAIDEIAWANKSVKERIRILQELQQYQANPAISAATTNSKFGPAAQNDLPNLAAHQAAYNAEVEKTLGAHKNLHDSGQSISQMWKNISLDNNRARTELIVIGHEMLQGRFSRVPGSMMVLAESSNIATLAMSAFGLTVLGITAVTVGLLVAMAKGALEFEKINAALIQTGGYSGITASNFYKMSEALVAVHGSIGEAKEAILLLAGSGRFTKEQIDTIAPSIVEMAHSGGVAVETLVKQFEKLAKDPVNASRELNEQYHYLTASVYEQIRALVGQGDKQGAATLAEEAYATATKARAAELAANLGVLSRAWHVVSNAASGAWNSMMGLGRPTNVEDKLKTVGQQIIDSNAKIANYTKLAGKDSENAARGEQVKLRALWDEQAALTKTRDDEILTQKQKSQRAQLEQDAINAQDIRKVNERKDYSQLQKRQESGAKIYQGDATEIANALAANGVSLDSLNKAKQTIALSVHATTEEVFNAAKARYDAVVSLAKANGKDLLITAESTAQRLANVDERRKDKRTAAVKENSNVELGLFIQQADREFALAQKLTDRKVRETEREYNSNKKIQDDNLVIARADSATKNQLHVADLNVYTNYVTNVHQVREKAANDEKQQLALELVASDERSAKIVQKAEQEVRLYSDGQLRLNNAIKKAEQERTTIKALNDQKVEDINDRTKQIDREAESKALKESTVDLDKKIEAMLKLVEARDKELARVGLTKAAIRDLEDTESRVKSAKIQLELEQVNSEKASGAQDEQRLAIYDKRIKQLEQYLVVSRKIVDSNTKLKASQADWEKGAEQGLTDYLDSTDNVFKTAQGIVSKSFKGMEDALVTFVTTGKLSVKSLASSIIADLVRVAVQANITRPLAAMLGGGGGAAGAAAQGVAGEGGGLLGLASNASSLNTLYGAGAQLLTGSAAGASGASLIGANAVGAVGGDAIGALATLNGGWAGLTTALTANTAALTPLAVTSVETGLATGAVVGGAAPIAAGGLTAVLGAIPVWGWAALAAVAAVSIFSGKKESASGSTGSLERTYDASGGITSSKSPFAVGNGAEVVDSLYTRLSGLQTLLGAKGGASFGYGAYSGTGNKNPQGRITGGSFNSGEVPVAELDLAASRAILSALQASDMPKGIAKIINSINPATASAEQIKALEENAATYSSSIKALNSAFDNLPFANLRNMAFDTADALVLASGGLQNLSANLASYEDNFHSEAEKKAQKVGDITRTLNAAGVGVTTDEIGAMTREQYRALVEGITSVSEANAPAVAALYATAGAFAQITPATTAATAAVVKTAEAVETYAQATDKAYASLTNTAKTAEQQAQTRIGLEDQLLQLTGTANQLRAKAIAGMDQSNISLYDSIQARTAEKTATAKATEALVALTSTNKQWQDQLDVLTGKETTRSIALRDATDESTKALMRQVYAQEDATKKQETVTTTRNNLISAYTTEQSSIQATVDKFRTFSASLKAFRDGLLLSNLSPLTPAQRYEEAARQFQIAQKNGDSDKLQTAASNLLDISKIYNASGSAYIADFAMVQNALTEAATSAAASADVQQLQLDAVKSQLALLGSINAGVQSLSQALTAFAQAAPGAAGSTGRDPFTDQQIKDFAAPLLGTYAGNKQVYDAGYANRDRGVTLARIDKAAGLKEGEAEAWAIANGMPVYHQGTNYVPRTGFALLQQGEAVLSRSQNSAGHSNKEVVAAVDNLRLELKEFRKQQSAETGAIIQVTHDSNVSNSTAIINNQSKTSWSQQPELV